MKRLSGRQRWRRRGLVGLLLLLTFPDGGADGGDDGPCGQCAASSGQAMVVNRWVVRAAVAVTTHGMVAQPRCHARYRTGRL